VDHPALFTELRAKLKLDGATTPGYRGALVELPLAEIAVACETPLALCLASRIERRLRSETAVLVARRASCPALRWRKL
jgi:hypothetical protein